MYAVLWRSLPGPWPFRALICLALLAAVVAVLFGYVFPEFAHLAPFNDITVGA